MRIGINLPLVILLVLPRSLWTGLIPLSIKGSALTFSRMLHLNRWHNSFGETGQESDRYRFLHPDGSVAVAAATSGLLV